MTSPNYISWGEVYFWFAAIIGYKINTVNNLTIRQFMVLWEQIGLHKNEILGLVSAEQSPGARIAAQGGKGGRRIVETIKSISGLMKVNEK